MTDAPHPHLARAVFDLSRGRQALLSVAQPALGALIALGGLPDLRTAGIGLLAASTGYLAVFSLNDVLDRSVDAAALGKGKAEAEGYDIDVAYLRHPLARGDLSLALSTSWVAGLGAVAAVSALVLSPACLALFALAVALEIAYCCLRSVTWAKTIVSGVMVGVGGLAGWVAVAPLDGRAWLFFAFLALWEIAGRNLPNDLADIGPDSATGVMTVATVFGPRASGRAIGAGAGATTAAAALLPLPATARIAAAGLSVWAMAVPAARLAARPTPRAAGAYFNRASLLPALILALAMVTAFATGSW